MHPLVRWQFRGGIHEDDRKGFLFENVVDSKGRQVRHPRRGRRAGVEPGDLQRRHRLSGRPDQGQVEPRRAESDRAGRGEGSAVPGARFHGRRPAAGERRRSSADPDLDAGVRQCAVFVVLDVHHQGPGYGQAEHRQLSRAGEVAQPDGHEPGGGAQPGHLRPLGEVQGARRANAGGAGARRAAVHHVHVGAQAAEASGRDGGCRRARRRADPHREGEDRRHHGAGGCRDRGRRLHRYAMSGAGRQLRRKPRLHEPEGVQRVLRRDRDHAAQGRDAGVDHLARSRRANRA